MSSVNACVQHGSISITLQCLIKLMCNFYVPHVQAIQLCNSMMQNE